MAATDMGSDGELVIRIATGDRPALAALYDRYAGTLLALGRRILGDTREAEDVVHDVFLELWRCAGDYDAVRGSVRVWIVMRMRSRSLDRKRSPRLARTVELDDKLVAPSDAPPVGLDSTRVRQALAGLPAEQRAVLELGYYEGLSSTEIAARQGIPVGTVKSRVAAALVRLRAGLGAPS